MSVHDTGPKCILDESIGTSGTLAGGILHKSDSPDLYRGNRFRVGRSASPRVFFIFLAQVRV